MKLQGCYLNICLQCLERPKRTLIYRPSVQQQYFVASTHVKNHKSRYVSAWFDGGMVVNSFMFCASDLKSHYRDIGTVKNPWFLYLWCRVHTDHTPPLLSLFLLVNTLGWKPGKDFMDLSSQISWIANTIRSLHSETNCFNSSKELPLPLLIDLVFVYA